MEFQNLYMNVLLIHPVSVHSCLEVKASRYFWRGLLLFRRFCLVEASLYLVSMSLMSGFITGRMVAKDKQYLVRYPIAKENLH